MPRGQFTSKRCGLVVVLCDAARANVGLDIVGQVYQAPQGLDGGLLPQPAGRRCGLSRYSRSLHVPDNACMMLASELEAPWHGFCVWCGCVRCQQLFAMSGQCWWNGLYPQRRFLGCLQWAHAILWC